MIIMVSAAVLVIIYISFISLGLPDSLAGTSWPLMHIELGADISQLGLISLTTSCGTIISALTYSKISRFIKTGVLNFCCTLLTGICLMLISRVESFWMMFPIALFLGIGAGSVDSSLNNYVAVHYKASHMSFLHAFWGVGAIFGPTVLSMLFRSGRSWRNAYTTVSIAQLSIAVLLLLTMGLWKKAEKASPLAAIGNEEKPKVHSIRKILRMKGVKLSVLSTYLYSTIECVTFVWAATFFTESRGFSESDAAIIVSMLYWGITTGRICSGMVSHKMDDEKLVITGLVITLAAGTGFMFGTGFWALMTSTFFIGFGFGPVFPSILHQTPMHFGIEESSAVMGLLMSGAYVGSAFMPFLFGLGTKLFTTGYLPWCVIVFSLLQIILWKKRKTTFRD